MPELTIEERLDDVEFVQDFMRRWNDSSFEEIEELIEENGRRIAALEGKPVVQDSGYTTVSNTSFSLCFEDEDSQYEYCAISSVERGFYQVRAYCSEDAIGQRGFYTVEVPELYQGKGRVTQIFRRSEDVLWINFVIDDTYDVVLEMDNRRWHSVGLEPEYLPVL